MLGVRPCCHIVLSVHFQMEGNRRIDRVAAAICQVAPTAGRAEGSLVVRGQPGHLPRQRISLRHRNHGTDIERAGAALAAGVGGAGAAGGGGPVCAIGGILPGIYGIEAGIVEAYGIGDGLALLQRRTGGDLLAVSVRHGDGAGIDRIPAAVHKDGRSHRKGLLRRKFHIDRVAVFRKAAQGQRVFAVGLAAFRPGVGFGGLTVDCDLPFLDHLTLVRLSGKDDTGAVSKAGTGLHRSPLAGLCRQASVTARAVSHGADLIGELHFHQKRAVGNVICGVKGADVQQLDIAADHLRDFIVRGSRSDFHTVDLPAFHQIAAVRGRLELQRSPLCLGFAAGKGRQAADVALIGRHTAAAVRDLVVHRRGIGDLIEAGAGKDDAVGAVQGGDVALLIRCIAPGQVHIEDAGAGIRKVVGAGYFKCVFQLCLITGLRKRGDLVSRCVRVFQFHGAKALRDPAFPDGGDRQLEGGDGQRGGGQRRFGRTLRFHEAEGVLARFSRIAAPICEGRHRRAALPDRREGQAGVCAHGKRCPSPRAGFALSRHGDRISVNDRAGHIRAVCLQTQAVLGLTALAGRVVILGRGQAGAEDVRAGDGDLNGIETGGGGRPLGGDHSAVSGCCVDDLRDAAGLVGDDEIRTDSGQDLAAVGLFQRRGKGEFRARLRIVPVTGDDIKLFGNGHRVKVGDGVLRRTLPFAHLDIVVFEDLGQSGIRGILDPIKAGAGNHNFHFAGVCVCAGIEDIAQHLVAFVQGGQGECSIRISIVVAVLLLLPDLFVLGRPGGSVVPQRYGVVSHCTDRLCHIVAAGGGYCSRIAICVKEFFRHRKGVAHGGIGAAAVGQQIIVGGIAVGACMCDLTDIDRRSQRRGFLSGFGGCTRHHLIHRALCAVQLEGRRNRPVLLCRDRCPDNGRCVSGVGGVGAQRAVSAARSRDAQRRRRVRGADGERGGVAVIITHVGAESDSLDAEPVLVAVHFLVHIGKRQAGAGRAADLTPDARTGGAGLPGRLKFGEVAAGSDLRRQRDAVAGSHRIGAVQRVDGDGVAAAGQRGAGGGAHAVHGLLISGSTAHHEGVGGSAIQPAERIGEFIPFARDGADVKIGIAGCLQHPVDVVLLRGANAGIPLQGEAVLGDIRDLQVLRGGGRRGDIFHQIAAHWDRQAIELGVPGDEVPAEVIAVLLDALHGAAAVDCLAVGNGFGSFIAIARAAADLGAEDQAIGGEGEVKFIVEAITRHFPLGNALGDSAFGGIARPGVVYHRHIPIDAKRHIIRIDGIGNLTLIAGIGVGNAGRANGGLVDLLQSKAFPLRIVFLHGDHGGDRAERLGKVDLLAVVDVCELVHQRRGAVYHYLVFLRVVGVVGRICNGAGIVAAPGQVVFNGGLHTAAVAQRR